MSRFKTMLLIAGAVLAALPPAVSDAGSAAKLPTRPLPPDMIEGFGEGTVLAFRYAASYVCLTTPRSDVDPPFARGDGIPESSDPGEYQLPPCVFGDSGTGSLPPFAPDGKPISKTRKLYGISLARSTNTPSLYATNLPEPTTDVQTQCAQPGQPITQVKGAPGTCLMHPSLLHVTLNTADLANQAPDPIPLPQHSHVIAGTSSSLVWWQAVGVFIFDRSIFPDLNGNCPAGRSKCATSLTTLRAAQRRGAASPDVPSNLFFYFSVQPVALGQSQAFGCLLSSRSPDEGA
jgi:hypothetical protein